MRQYAVVDDIEARWRTLSDAERAKARVLIEDVTAQLFSMGAEDDGTAERARSIKAVICKVVIRAMLPEQGIPGATQYSQTVGAVTESFQLANPNGDMYLTRQEKRAVGIGAGRTWFGNPKGVRRC